MRFVLLSALLALPALSETLTKGDRDQLMSHLHATRKQFLDFIAPLSEAQWKFKPAPERWSIAECAEHITETESALRGLITASAAKLPVDEAKREARKAKRAESTQTLLTSMSDRSKRATAPGEIAPSGRYGSKAALIPVFEQRRAETIRYVETTEDDLRGKFRKFGPSESDLVEMLYVISGHTERHLLQMKEVTAAPGYPKN